jgi:hypothetical protein
MKISKAIKKIPVLPLTPKKRIKGLVKLVTERKMFIGDALADFHENDTDIEDIEMFVEELVAIGSLVNLEKTGYMTVNCAGGLRVSWDQLIESYAIHDACPENHLCSEIQTRIYSFHMHDQNLLANFLTEAQKMHVHVKLTNVAFTPFNGGSTADCGLYAVEFLTTSKISVIYKVLDRAGLTDVGVDQTLQECAAAENTYTKDPEARARNTEREARKLASIFASGNVLAAMPGELLATNLLSDYVDPL